MTEEGNNRWNYKLLPVFLSVAIVVGIWLGSKLAPPANQPIIFPGRAFNDVNKINEILNYIRDAYVDTVDKNALVETSIENMLQSLDPHSHYISPQEYAAVTEPLEGNLEGIGIEFRIIKDTVVVMNSVENGPSAKAGISSGDRIIRVNDSLIAGVGISNEGIISLLKGKKGTKVKVSLIHMPGKDTLNLELTRAKIPIKSIEAAYMIDAQTGYIKIERFGRNTYDEFVENAEKLKDKGLKHLILDLRNNGGGYLNAATKIVDEFLPGNELIVYTEGRSRPKNSVFGNKGGIVKETKLYLLINEYSASASEVLAGAIQDNDRGTIVGRRSFGKGLVQEQIDLPDGSAVRLTVARYYTPTGRSIQKPYGLSPEEYHKEAFERRGKGELQYADSIKILDSLKYSTPKGKVVYGGGGITPDVFVPADSSKFNIFLNQLRLSGVFMEVAFEFTDANRDLIDKYPDVSGFDKNFEVGAGLLKRLTDRAKELGIKPDYDALRNEKEWVKTRLKADIAQNYWGLTGYSFVMNKEDRMISRTLQLIGNK